ncbi:PSD1 and planctomycete cytochrome C domain-containing protein [Aureliella helgolandensis]|uniref:Planctomycete cytochrome C n=1 Tax=Aureliella helgolandensis TaxID=2527968 RepID=A0A518GCT8_9BACT|nr:PSD1 and planctomycete cytochrome C domain-containing protein [Aureliella helgolandensis]QDV26411.1 Planctomycete cytochrome C [Aureliella helgolandensis]
MNVLRIRTVLTCLVLVIPGAVLLSPAAGQEGIGAADRGEGLRLFESKIRPVLAEHCYECHSARDGADEGGLQLDTPRAIQAGGDRGNLAVSKMPNASLLLRAIAHTDVDIAMPPKQDRLSDTIVGDFRKWIELGAVVPEREVNDVQGREKTQAHWALQPICKAKIPDLRGSTWAKKPVDAFILAGLEAQGLEPSADAPVNVLLRRLHFDVVGLPPSPADILRFTALVAAEGMDLAVAQEVDRLLETQEFGERWGRHWLDVARFAESSGKAANISFPYAWRFRDYVFDCFNDDLPFDRFILEQIAGDLLPYESDQQRARLLIATGFLAIGVKNLDEMSAPQFRADVIDEQIDTVTRAFTGSSVACARCHDHKFESYTMEDYYALAGIFSSTKTLFGTWVAPSNRVGGDPLPLPIGREPIVLHKSISAERVASLKAEKESLLREREDFQAMNMGAMMMSEGKEKVPKKEFTLRDALRIFWRVGAIDGQLEKVDANGNAIPLAMGVLDDETITDATLLLQGDIKQPNIDVPRGVPFFDAMDEAHQRLQFPADQSGRLELAQWLTHATHPLTARVYVNRVWKHLMGEGIVRTVDDFGTTGEAPSHPDLLDYLATRFVEDGWSTKRLVRHLLLSRTYRQSSEHREAAFLADPDNRLLWRQSKRRLEAEAMRDAMLAVSGEIDLQRPIGSLVGRVIGDRPISLIGLDKRLPPDLDGTVHRSVYLPVIRDRMPDILDLFDVANPDFVSGAREATSTPLQSLYLMNSPFVRDRAAAMKKRLQAEADTTEERLRLAFEYCYARPPFADESQRLSEFLNSTAREEAELAWVDVCHSLLVTAEFRNLD